MGRTTPLMCFIFIFIFFLVHFTFTFSQPLSFFIFYLFSFSRFFFTSSLLFSFSRFFFSTYPIFMLRFSLGIVQSTGRSFIQNVVQIVYVFSSLHVFSFSFFGFLCVFVLSHLSYTRAMVFTKNDSIVY